MRRVTRKELIDASLEHVAISSTVTGGGTAALVVTFPDNTFLNKNIMSLVIAQPIPINTTAGAGAVTITDGTITGNLVDIYGQQVFQDQLITSSLSGKRCNRHPINVILSGVATLTLFCNFSGQITHKFSDGIFHDTGGAD